ncbi:GIN domain-containing protein [Ancylomarina sp. YFZ004]
MKTHTFYFTLAIISFLFNSCSEFIFWEGEDDRINKTIEITNVNKIHIESVFHIELVQDTEEYIIATGSEKQLNKLEIHSKGDTSFFKHQYTNLVKNYTPIKLEVHLKKINSINVSSPSNIISKTSLTNNLNILVLEDAELVEMNLNLNCQKLSFHVKGPVSGRYQFKGECPDASYVLNGTTNIEAIDFKNQYINIAQNGIGEAHIYAEQKITANIYSFGNIYYKGNPEIIIKRIQINNQSPTAKLIPVNNSN